jgi:hypothetical protein
MIEARADVGADRKAHVGVARAEEVERASTAGVGLVRRRPEIERERAAPAEHDRPLRIDPHAAAERELDAGVTSAAVAELDEIERRRGQLEPERARVAPCPPGAGRQLWIERARRLRASRRGCQREQREERGREEERTPRVTEPPHEGRFFRRRARKLIADGARRGHDATSGRSPTTSGLRRRCDRSSTSPRARPWWRAGSRSRSAPRRSRYT